MKKVLKGAAVLGGLALLGLAGTVAMGARQARKTAEQYDS